MAADIVASPTTTHTFIYDIESAFWVLLWMAYAYAPNSDGVGTHSSFLKGTMSPRVFADTGGKNKLFFLQDDSALWEFKVTNNQIFTDLLQGLKSTLAV